MGERTFLSTCLQSYFMKLNLFQFSFQVIMITEAAKVGSEGGHSWMSSVLRGEGEEATM